MKLLTFKEWVEDRNKQLSECPCNDCKYRMDHDSPNYVCLNNDWEPLYPREYPLSFACVWKKGWLDTKVMRNKECLYKNRSDINL